MTTKEALHHLMDELPEDQTELARVLLQDLHDAATLTGRRSTAKPSHRSTGALPISPPGT